VQGKTLPFWIAYGRAGVFFFLGLMVLDWIAYFVWGSWLERWGMLVLVMVMPGLGLMITWDEI
jgi:hypothetical protein